jgi:hypothetical protein
MADAVGEISKIGGGLIMNIVKGLGIIAVSVGLFYLTRFIQKGTKKAKSFTINAAILDLNGVIEFDMLAFTKSEDSGLLEMNFQKRKMDSIPPIPKHLIKNNLVLLLNYAPGHYCVIDTSQTVWNFNNGVWEIVPVNLGMKKYITAKQREIMNKSEAKKAWWTEKAPWIVLISSVVVAAVLTAFLFYVGAYLEAKNIALRIAECKR